MDNSMTINKININGTMVEVKDGKTYVNGLDTETMRYEGFSMGFMFCLGVMVGGIGFLIALIFSVKMA